MPEKKTDRRTLKTRKAIYEGLAELLAEKSLKNITVQELTDKIDIHRVTFYKHFRDIYDVYEQLE
ncbi:MAG: TetR/AcrR family transcriptional regulator, partial [Ruminococcus sp.]|nr:TetR/AcrR family transcriptional regulator [Ruminococcus sp.]